MRLLCLICRLIVGATFMLSGFTKAVDPWGTIYKLADYSAAFGITSPHELLTAGAFLLAGGEFVIGVMVLTGSFRRLAPALAAAVMVVMLPLSAWIAATDPVPDCGCFGDAIVISNTATFIKNIILSAAVVMLLVKDGNRRVHWFITPALQWLGLTFSALFIIGISLRGYSIQPLIDFRPYKIGSPLFSESDDESQIRYTFIYEKDGVRHEFDQDEEMPDEEDGWKFIDRREIIPENASTTEKKEIESLHLWDTSGTEDVTEEALAEGNGNYLLIMIPSLREVTAAATWKINALKAWADNLDIATFAVVAGSEQEIADWEDLSLAEYPIYTAEDTVIKEVVRGNPAIVLVSDNKIAFKETLGAVNDTKLDEQERIIRADELFRSGRRVTMPNIWCYGYMAAMAMLVILSFVPATGKLLFKHSEQRTAYSVQRIENSEQRTVDSRQ